MKKYEVTQRQLSVSSPTEKVVRILHIFKTQEKGYFLVILLGFRKPPKLNFSFITALQTQFWPISVQS